MRFSLAFFLVFATLIPVSRLAERESEINVNVEVTPDGKKVTRPAPDKPTYFYPLAGGFREEGDKVAGVKQPPPEEVTQLLLKTLKAEGYEQATFAHPPSILLVYHWGYMNPEIVEDDSGEDVQKLNFNRKEMLLLVGGQTIGNLDLDSERESVMQGAEDDRFFVVVQAYDFQAALKRQKKLLWRAKMSTPSNGVTLSDVLPALITSGGPFFGRETKRPEWQMKPVGKDGKVEIGPMEVQSYLNTQSDDAEEPTKEQPTSEPKKP